MIDWVNSLSEKPTAYDQAVTTILQQLPQNEFGSMLKAFTVEPPSDAPMALSLIRGIRENRYAKGVLFGELVQQLASGLGEEWLNNAEVRFELNGAIADAAATMPRRDALNYLATGGGGIIPEVAVGTWSPAWIEWAEKNPSDATKWLAESEIRDKRTDIVQALSKRATQENVTTGFANTGIASCATIREIFGSHSVAGRLSGRCRNQPMPTDDGTLRSRKICRGKRGNSSWSLSGQGRICILL